MRPAKKIHTVSKIVFDAQHGQKGPNYDNGAVCGDLIEAELVRRYAGLAHNKLLSLGYDSHIIDSGYYSQRARIINKLDPDIVIACHLNSAHKPPTTHYSLVEATELAGPVTRKFARHLADVFRNKLPVDKSRVNYIQRNERGWSCLYRVRPSIVLAEPVFINHPAGRELLTNNIGLISDCIVMTIKTFDWEG